MNSFQLAWRSIIRKPVKSILLLLMVSIISLFFLSCLASEKASIVTQDKTRQAVGAGFLLVANDSNRHERLSAISEKIGDQKEGSLDGVHQKKLETAGGTSWQVWTDNSFETLKLADIKKIAQVPGISGYNITTAYTAVNPVNFSRIEDSDTDQSTDKLGVCLLGSRDMTMDANVLSGNVFIKAGRMVQKSDTNVCVISAELAAQNKLSVGRRIQFNDYHDKTHSDISEAEIIGIYQVKQKMSPYMSGDTYRSENVIFTDLRFPEKAEGSKNDPLFEKAYFKVANVDRYEAVKNTVKQAAVDWQCYDFIDNNGKLDIMSENFNDLGNISRILLWLAAGSGLVILFLIFVFWLKSRNREIGIFLALGHSKVRILNQILCEAMIIAAAALFLSLAAAPGISKVTAAYLVSQQIQKAAETKASDSGKVSTDRVDPEQCVTGVDVAVTLPMALLDGMGVTVLITVSVMSAGAVILRKSPKDILSEMS